MARVRPAGRLLELDEMGRELNSISTHVSRRSAASRTPSPAPFVRPRSMIGSRSPSPGPRGASGPIPRPRVIAYSTPLFDKGFVSNTPDLEDLVRDLHLPVAQHAYDTSAEGVVIYESNSDIPRVIDSLLGSKWTSYVHSLRSSSTPHSAQFAIVLTPAGSSIPTNSSFWIEAIVRSALDCLPVQSTIDIRAIAYSRYETQRESIIDLSNPQVGLSASESSRVFLGPAGDVVTPGQLERATRLLQQYRSRAQQHAAGCHTIYRLGISCRGTYSTLTINELQPLRSPAGYINSMNSRKSLAVAEGLLLNLIAFIHAVRHQRSERIGLRTRSNLNYHNHHAIEQGNLVFFTQVQTWVPDRAAKELGLIAKLLEINLRASNILGEGIRKWQGESSEVLAENLLRAEAMVNQLSSSYEQLAVAHRDLEAENFELQESYENLQFRFFQLQDASNPIAEAHSQMTDIGTAHQNQDPAQALLHDDSFASQNDTSEEWSFEVPYRP